MERIHSEDLDRSLVRLAAQWRLDWPLPGRDVIAGTYRNVLAIAEALLTRGTTPFCSPSFEQTIETWFPDTTNGLVHDALLRVASVPSVRFQPLEFDSDEERQLLSWLTQLIVNEQIPLTVTPQVALASLTPSVDRQANERVDFLLVHPTKQPLVVEVDGAFHEEHRARDQERDRALQEAGVEVVRVTAADVRRGEGPTLDRLRDALLARKTRIPDETPLSRLIRCCKFHHQVQLALLTGLRGGWLSTSARWRVGIVPPPGLQGEAISKTIAEQAASDLVELLNRLARIHSHPAQIATPSVVTQGFDDQDLDILIAPATPESDRIAPTVRARLLYSDFGLPSDLRAPLTAATPMYAPSPTKEDVRWFLRYIFRKDDFWEGQWETIERALQGRDAIVLLPTGGGKTIAFQLPALLLPGRCLVVAPLISLIEDQLDNLARVGIDRAIGITSEAIGDKRQLALEAFGTGHYLFCYVAPERLQITSFREELRRLTVNTPISLIAIDEAHCVSEWGHDFRTAYLNLGRITREYCTSKDRDREVIPPLIALTGTASRIVLKDVQRELGITSLDSVITPSSFDRPELSFFVLFCRSEEKPQRLLGFLQQLPTEFGVDRSVFFQPAGSSTHAGLVFCPHVRGTYGILKYQTKLTRALQTPVGIYGSRTPKNFDRQKWQALKRSYSRDFKRDRVALLACTSAFGMGIDKPNIRYTVHIGLPQSIEAFYQEAGRAGRDRRPAKCAIILSNDDPKRSQFLLNPSTPLKDIAHLVSITPKEDCDDILRALWFHTQSFRGQDSELDDIKLMLRQIGDAESRRHVNVTWRSPEWWSESGSDDESDDEMNKPRERAEKALHRLVVLGVVEDYTVNYASQEFAIRVAGATKEEIAAAFGRFVGTYQRRLGERAEQEPLTFIEKPYHEYVLAVAEKLVSFIYEHVELARRRALSEMLQAVQSARTGEDLRKRILDYLQQSEWDERLEHVRTSPLGGVDVLDRVLDDILTREDAVALRAAAGRALASYPDVPGLLMLRAFAEAMSPNPNSHSVQEDIAAAVTFGQEKFGLPSDELAAAIAMVASRAMDTHELADQIVRASLARTHEDRSFLRTLVRKLPPELGVIPACVLLGHLATLCSHLTKEEDYAG